ncbi:MAG: sigma-54 dependent transcriptional regulator [Planctomycetota bacterium]|nr:sigma-54 dependent transcriptional regulator [Planctomycetota bacterium]
MNLLRERVLVVDDEPDMAESCCFLLTRAGYATSSAASGEAALQLVDKKSFAVVLSDIRMPRMSGLQLLALIKQRDPDVEVILITGHPEIQSAVAAIKQGAFDYLTKPYVEKDLLERVAKAVAHRRLKDKNLDLKERLRSGPEGRRLIYRSKSFGDLVLMLTRAARSDASVLIQGESGTGKELLAHHLHDSSTRSSKPFVPVDCTSIAADLFESELFGHVKGAFTGATSSRLGLFQVADGGTLFFDELGELPLPFQAKLLRAIQERTVRPVGSTEEVPIDVRIVAATNRNLGREVEDGRFRQDLFYRLDVVRIEVPPLRDRREDILELAEHFLHRFGGQDGITFASDVKALLAAYHWPGNVRHLRNAIERGCALSHDKILKATDLPSEVAGGEATQNVTGLSAQPQTFQGMKARSIMLLENSYLKELLRKHQGNVTHSADEAGMTRSALQKLLLKHNLKGRDFRE